MRDMAGAGDVAGTGDMAGIGGMGGTDGATAAGWSAPLDGYCERLGPEFWAEPVNALTNAAFLVAALIAYLDARRRGGLDAATVLLLALVVAVGIGSFLFHTVATAWAAVADVAPIQLFILVYFALAMRRFVGLGWPASLAATAGFAVVSVAGAAGLAALAADALNGSEGYVPPLLALAIVGAALARAGRPGAGFSLLAAALLFAVSLGLRTVDAAVCERIPFGTHFLWHTLNGVLLGGLIIALGRFGRAS